MGTLPVELPTSIGSTAVGVATLRAAHQILDGDPKIIDDPVSARLIDRATLDEIRDTPAWFQSAMTRGLRAQILTRGRYAEERLAEAAARGVDQFVMLGAGLDTFPYRQPPWAAALRIFEVDHDSALADKRARLGRAGIAVPDNVTPVSIDFEDLPRRRAEPAGSLGHALARHGFDRGRPAFLSWLGVMAYLSPDAAQRVLIDVATMAPSAEIVFTFHRPLSTDAGAGAERSTSHSDAVAAMGEPWKTRIEPDELAERLRDLGYAPVTFVDPDQVAGYFAGRTDGLAAPSRIRIVRALIS